MFIRYLKALFGLRQQAKIHGLGRLSLYLINRIGIRNPVATRNLRRFVIALKITLHPIDYLARRRIGDLMGETSARISDDGYLVMPSRLPKIDILITHLLSVFERRKEEEMKDYKHPYAFFLTSTKSKQGSVLENEKDWEPVIEFASQPEIVAIVAAYMQEIPVVGEVSLIYTPAEFNDQIVGPQLFHTDNNHKRMVHLLIAILPITKDGGPFTFVPRRNSEKIKKAYNHEGGRLTDEKVFSIVSPNDLIECVGDAGQAFFVNPNQCLHQGARVKTNERLVLIINYTSRFESGESVNAVYRAANRSMLNSNDPLRHQLLALSRPK